MGITLSKKQNIQPRNGASCRPEGTV